MEVDAVVKPDILGYAYTAIKSLLEVFLIGFSGYIFAKNGTLNKSTLKSLSLISVNLLTPALMFSKMTETLNPGLLLELWNEPIFYFVYGGFSLLWSRVGSRVLRLNSDYARLCDVATFFSNTNTLPVSLIKSIALSSGASFLLKDADDTPLKVAARGVSYAMIFATLNNILRWSFGVALMGGLAPKNKSAFNSVNNTPRASIADPSARRHISGESDGSDELTPLMLGESMQGFPYERSRLARVTAAVKQRGQSIWEGLQACITPPVYAIVAAFIVITIQPLHHAFMDPDTVLYTLWSAIDMCGDACVPLILISLGGQLGMMAREEHQKPHSDDIEQSQFSCAQTHGPACVDDDDDDGNNNTAGATRTHSSTELCDTSVCTIHQQSAMPPSIVLRTATESGAATVELCSGRSPGPGRLCIGEPATSLKEQRAGVILVLVGRFVFVPTLAVILITTLRIMLPGLLPIMAQDPVYTLTLLILSSTPPAINLITVSQATGKYETEAAQILFYGYVLGIFVLAVEVSGFLWLTNVLSSA
ncbi:hypothetical protein GGF46_004056 [Coemansia sp. RSA 552]|nr:hypothetical protein GGF46_004056 [Coemansia sp. RSA 552]